MNTYQPPKGINYHLRDGNIKAIELAHSLQVITSYLQKNSPESNLIQYADWWEHDGLHFKKGEFNFHKLFSIISSPQSIFENMPGDDYVFIGVSPEENNWYLRFYLDWDENGEGLEGRFDITISSVMLDAFENEVIRKLKVGIESEESCSYYSKIIV